MAVCPQHFLLSRRLLRYSWTPQMVSHPPVHDFEGRLDCRGLHAYGLGAAGPDVCHSGPASVGVGVCGHHGVRIELHAFHSDYIFWGWDLARISHSLDAPWLDLCPAIAFSPLANTPCIGGGSQNRWRAKSLRHDRAIL